MIIFSDFCVVLQQVRGALAAIGRLTIGFETSIVGGMASEDILYISDDTARERLRETIAHKRDAEIFEWFAPHAQDFGSVLLESSLSAYGRGGRTFAAINPTDCWALEHDQPIPSDWVRLLDSFLADKSAFYALFFSYDFGAELVAGSLAPEGEIHDDLLAGKVNSEHGEYKALALKFSEVCVEYDTPKSVSRSAKAPSAVNSAASESARILSRPERSTYIRDIGRIKNHIHEGDIYQANLTVEWTVESCSEPWDVYRRLRALNPCQYGGFANLGKYTILSTSPERLISVEKRRIIANPLKGTIALGDTARQTQRNVCQLTTSEKDRAELLMIVDLLRNDLGKVCKVGSVRTPALWRPETYSSLIHLSAEISGELRENVSIAEILSAVFPGGSISGAPKRRAIRILNEIEGRSRGIYTGSFGYKYGSELDLNIAIRTLTYFPVAPDAQRDLGVYRAQAGGGIVADSDAESEHKEACLKVSNLLKAIDMSLRP